MHAAVVTGGLVLVVHKHPTLFWGLHHNPALAWSPEVGDQLEGRLLFLICENHGHTREVVGLHFCALSSGCSTASTSIGDASRRNVFMVLVHIHWAPYGAQGSVGL
jgi:hypothetical protein